mgnify:CR=1 FL=1
MTHASLFSGIGGFDLAARNCGIQNIFQVEINEFCRKVLEKNFPETKKYRDIKEFDGTEYYGTIDIISGGFPCQPFSVAGKQRGAADERYLWGEMLRVIRECLPRWVVAENVRGLLAANDEIEFEKVCASLEDEGYTILPNILPATIADAPHRRERIFIVGRYFESIDTDTESNRIGEFCDTIQTQRDEGRTLILREPFGLHWAEAISRIHGVYNGLSRGLDRRRNAALGNAIVPQVAEILFKAMIETDKILCD